MNEPLLHHSCSDTTNTTTLGISNKQLVRERKQQGRKMVGVLEDDSTMNKSNEDGSTSSSGSVVTQAQRKPGGWKSMPYILGNETFERLASFGLLANFMVYLLREYHLDQVFATNINNIWSGTTNFAPLVGAFISDSYLGKFRTIAYASIASQLGMVALTLTALIPRLRPPTCSTQQQQHNQCVGPSAGQLSFLYMTLGLLTIGSSGIRPCSVPFGVDQFDQKTEEGRKGINSFFNWYYFSYTVVIMISLTVIIYIQDAISWSLGFGIPTILMFCAILLFFLGTRVYIYVPPGGSILSGIAQVFVNAFENRHIDLPSSVEDQLHGLLYDPPLKENVLSKLPLTNQFRFLNKAAILIDAKDGSSFNEPKLCSIQQVEEVKCLIRVAPIWSTTIIFLLALVAQSSFTISQALKMNRHLGPNFQIPAGSLLIFSMLTVTILIPIYDQIFVPTLRKITKQEAGITVLQRMGIGLVFSILAMVLSAFIEKKRRDSAISHILWLAPQHVLMGFAEAFNIIGQLEFCNKQFPEHMRSIANSLFSVNMAVASYLSTALIAVIHNKTGTHDHPDWLYKDIDVGRLDYFYYFLAGLGVLNFIYYLVVAQRFRYKANVPVGVEDMDIVGTELRSTKHADP